MFLLMRLSTVSFFGPVDTNTLRRVITLHMLAHALLPKIYLTLLVVQQR